ncbi:MAG TPA: hypothetical protein VHP33_13245 [Polyangiaceae bacterium]|nr:hypothetical protein [Polyangiaceae bacterium]
MTIPPESHSQPASSREEDPHESVTIAPPAPSFEEMLRQVTPIPSLENSSDQHFRAAVDAGSRAGSSLSELSKIVAELSGGLSGAKQANEQLVYELTTLRAMLGSANEQQLALRHKNALLEQELAAVQSAAQREREFLTEQHDDFLAALLEEHEEALAARDSQDDTRRMSPEVGDLAQKLVQAESARVAAENECQRAREASSKLQAQRDEAQARAEKRERERDELRAEASQLRARLGTHRSMSTTPPPPVVSSRPPSFRPPKALQLDDSELDSTLHARSSSPRLPSLKPRLTPPPAELASAVYTPRQLTPPPRAVSTSAPASSPAPAGGSTPSSAPTAEAFPRESTRPGVGGPKPSEPPPPPSFGPPPSGWTPVPPAPEPEPAKAPAARPPVISAASMPPGMPSLRPLKQKPDPTTRPLIDYSLGGDGVLSETLEGARMSSKPPRK